MRVIDTYAHPGVLCLRARHAPMFGVSREELAEQTGQSVSRVLEWGLEDA